MSKKKLTETKLDRISFADEVERVTDDFMADRNEAFDEAVSHLVNRHTFVSDLTSALDSLPDGDILLCDSANEIGRVIANFNSAHKSHLREIIRGLEHGFDLIAIEKGVGDE